MSLLVDPEWWAIRRQRVDAALSEAGYPNATIDSDRWASRWGIRRSVPPEVAWRALILTGPRMSICWPCYRDWNDRGEVEGCAHDWRVAEQPER